MNMAMTGISISVLMLENGAPARANLLVETDAGILGSHGQIRMLDSEPFWRNSVPNILTVHSAPVFTRQ
jgi:hypothetical protein